MTTQLYRVGRSAVTVRAPDAGGYNRDLMTVGQATRSVSGALIRQSSGEKRIWRLTWSHLTAAEFNTLYAELARIVPMTFKPEDEAVTYTVLRVGDVEVEATEYGYTVQARLEQV